MQSVWRFLLLLITISVLSYIAIYTYHAIPNKKQLEMSPADTDVSPKSLKTVIYKAKPQPKLLHNREEFRYPLEVDIVDLVQKVLTHNVRIDLEPLNDVSRYPELHSPLACSEAFLSTPEYERQPKPLDLLLVVKSSADHFENRQTIRKLWGKPSCWGGFHVRRVFILGKYHATNSSSLLERRKQTETQYRIVAEADEFQDIVQLDFVESYYNVTLKLHCSLEWVARHCGRARDFLFVDDDVLVHPRRVVRYLTHDLTIASRWKFAIWGNKMPASAAIRDPRGPFRKWYISPKDYPYEFFPLYPSGAAYFVSPFHLKRLAVAMRYIKYIPFDDAYLGIVMLKLNTSMSEIGHMLDIFHRKHKTPPNETLGYHMPLARSKQNWSKFNYVAFCL